MRLELIASPPQGRVPANAALLKGGVDDDVLIRPRNRPRSRFRSGRSRRRRRLGEHKRSHHDHRCSYRLVRMASSLLVPSVVTEAVGQHRMRRVVPHPGCACAAGMPCGGAKILTTRGSGVLAAQEDAGSSLRDRVVHGFAQRHLDHFELGSRALLDRLAPDDESHLRDLVRKCLKPRKSKVSGFPSPSFPRCLAA
jgi:hypothetical protein